MSKVDLLLQLPARALKEIADYLAMTHARFNDRSGWLKIDYAEELARTLNIEETETLVDDLRPDGESHYTLALLVRLFGLPPKEVMLGGTKAQLRDLMEELESDGRVAIPWRSMSAADLRDYLTRRFSAAEIARLVGLDVPAEKPPARSALKKAARPNLAATPSPALAPVAVPVASTAPQPALDHGRIERLEDLRHYLVERFQTELDELEDLGSNEQRFQHRIVSLLERRVSPEPFAIEEKLHLAELDQYPDVMIQHARGHTAIEIKPSGSLNELLVDAEKLRGYLRAKRVRVNFGVLVYRSPFAIPDELKRAMNSSSLHIVRVKTRRR